MHITVNVCNGKNWVLFQVLVLVLFRKLHELFWKPLSPLAMLRDSKTCMGEGGKGQRTDESRNDATTDCPKTLWCYIPTETYYYLPILVSSCIVSKQSSFPTLLPRAAPRATGTRANDSCGISDMYLLRWLLPGKEFSIFPLGCQKEYWKHFSVLYNFK